MTTKRNLTAISIGKDAHLKLSEHIKPKGLPLKFVVEKLIDKYVDGEVEI